MADGLADPRELLVRRRPPLEIGPGDLAPDVGERRALGRVVDDDEVPVLRVARGRRLLRELQALLQHLALDRPRQVESLADRTRRREELVRRQLEDHAAIIARGIRSARASRLARRPARVAVRVRATLDRHVPAGAAAALGRLPCRRVGGPADADGVPRRARARTARRRAAQRPLRPARAAARRARALRRLLVALRGRPLGRRADRAPVRAGPRRRRRNRHLARDRPRSLRRRRARAVLLDADARERNRSDPRAGHRRPAPARDVVARHLRRSRGDRRGAGRRDGGGTTRDAASRAAERGRLRDRSRDRRRASVATAPSSATSSCWGSRSARCSRTSPARRSSSRRSTTAPRSCSARSSP